MLVAIESTIPPGTTVNFAKPLLEESGLRVEEDLYLAHVPERIAPGRAIQELLNEPRVVGIGSRSTEKALELYSGVNPKLHPTDASTALTDTSNTVTNLTRCVQEGACWGLACEGAFRRWS